MDQFLLTLLLMYCNEIALQYLVCRIIEKPKIKNQSFAAAKEKHWYDYV